MLSHNPCYINDVVIIGILTIELTPKLTDACFIAELELHKNSHLNSPTAQSLRISIFP